MASEAKSICARLFNNVEEPIHAVSKARKGGSKRVNPKTAKNGSIWLEVRDGDDRSIQRISNPDTAKSSCRRPLTKSDEPVFTKSMRRRLTPGCTIVLTKASKPALARSGNKSRMPGREKL